jgi:hypothetical protein
MMPLMGDNTPYLEKYWRTLSLCCNFHGGKENPVFYSPLNSSELNMGLISNPTAPLNGTAIDMTIALITVATDAFWILSVTDLNSIFVAPEPSKAKCISCQLIFDQVEVFQQNKVQTIPEKQP